MESTGGARPTTTVQDLAVGAQDVPARFVARGHHDHDHETATAPVPVIDLGRLFQQDGSGAAVDEAAKLRSALESWGLFLVSNHGVGADVMDGMMAASRDFFRRPAEEKQIYTNLIGGERFQLQGYGTDRVSSPDQVLDWSDRLYLKVEPEDERSLTLWPAHPQNFRDLLHEFTTKCRGLKYSLLLAMAKLLELDDDYLVDQLGEKADTHARFSYYPECSKPELVFGLKPHSDGTVLSILMVDESVGGLQVLKDGIWFDVPIVPRTLLVNIGDQTEIISNGIFRSPVHRVMTNADSERLSVALFYSVDPEREIEPAAQLVDENKPALYRKVKVKDYLAGFYGRFSQGAMVIDTVKI
ncbi:2-oxoglutarate-dependent dioxygenase 11-like isoform X1 [Lolium rigidum]|uniref:2-oxoglutarate-dependent dioxygenase 11-like isoform X1 n=1 Tax=Lolium rigidum TaxID=89674 RepID=UPI001F5C6B62|nr:2-oxoglutarate-dependent dioxygenase 11-like isoform X1 [Lolium rigidum]